MSTYFSCYGIRESKSIYSILIIWNCIFQGGRCKAGRQLLLMSGPGVERRDQWSDRAEVGRYTPSAPVSVAACATETVQSSAAVYTLTSRDILYFNPRKGQLIIFYFSRRTFHSFNWWQIWYFFILPVRKDIFCSVSKKF